MVKHVLRWNSVKTKSIYGNPIVINAAPIIEHYYKGTLLSQILTMPSKKSISLEAAINIICEKQEECFAAGQIGHKPGQYFWYYRNFISFISDLGFHIELSGDEFEPAALSDRLA